MISAKMFSRIFPMNEVHKLGMTMNYRNIWDKQELPDFLINDIIQIAYITREVFFRPNIGNVETYCKKTECWEEVKKLSYELSVSTKAFLLNKNDIREEKITARKEQKFSDGISTEVEVFNFGEEYWSNLSEIGFQQGVLNGGDVQLLALAVEYCKGTRSLPQYHFKRIMEIRDKLRDAQIKI